MKRLGLIGSPSLETTLGYLRTINREAQKKHGSDYTADTVLYSQNARRLTQLVDGGEWQKLADILKASARHAVNGGADQLVLCGSALNPLATEIERALGRPVACIGEAMATTLGRFGLTRAGFLGIRSRREAQMWRRHLGSAAVMLPPANEQARLRRLAQFSADADTLPMAWQVEVTLIVSQLRRNGANAVVLCAPELSRLATPDEMLLPVFDAGEVHAWAAAGWALEEGRLMPASN